MKPGMKIANHIAPARRIAPLLLGSCLLLAVAGSAQTHVDPLHQMSPAQQQHAMFGPGQSLPVAQNHAAKPATPVKPANDGNQAGCGRTMKVRKTRVSRSERRKCHRTGSFVGSICPSGKVPEGARNHDLEQSRDERNSELTYEINNPEHLEFKLPTKQNPEITPEP